MSTVNSLSLPEQTVNQNITSARLAYNALHKPLSEYSSADLNAYPISGIKAIEINIPTTAWSGSNPYTYTVINDKISATDWCAFSFNVDYDIEWETKNKQVILGVNSIPTEALKGTLLLVETQPTVSSEAPYPINGIRVRDVYIPVNAWSTNNVAEIIDTAVSDNTVCIFTLSSGSGYSIAWTSDDGRIILEAATKPTIPIIGTVALVEVK